MKKLLIILSFTLIAYFVFGQDVLQQFMYTDDFNLVTPLYAPDGVTPIPDGWAIHVCIPTIPGFYDVMNDPHGTELNNNWGEDFMNGSSVGIGEGFFLTNAYFNWEDDAGSPPEPVANCTTDQIYLRIFDNADWTLAGMWRHSEFITSPACGSGTSELEISNWEAWEGFA